MPSRKRRVPTLDVCIQYIQRDEHTSGLGLLISLWILFRDIQTYTQ